jgi:hypothetical protein
MTAHDTYMSRDDAVAIFLSCSLGLSFALAFTHITALPLAAWFGGFAVWVSMKQSNGERK